MIIQFVRTDFYEYGVKIGGRQSGTRGRGILDRLVTLSIIHAEPYSSSNFLYYRPYRKADEINIQIKELADYQVYKLRSRSANPDF